MILTDLGGIVESKLAVIPAEFGNAGTVNGPGIDRKGYLSAVFQCLVGASTGTPSSISIAFQVEESDDNSTFAAVSGVLATVTTASTCTEINVDLSGRKRYIRLVPTATLSGGSTPKTKLAASCVLGGKNVNPA